MNTKLKRIAIISSKGGHLGQMKLLFTPDVIKDNFCILITEDKAPSVRPHSFLGKYTTYFFKKDFLLNPLPFRYISTTMKLMRLLRKEKIDLLFTNGAQLSIPAVIAGKMLGIKTVFIDTVIRVKTPSWSARAAYPFADIFWVQHREMARKYGKKAKYIGGII